jgi:ribonucleoside-diphosphate reductase alpha chain
VVSSIYDELSKERKELQTIGKLPSWTTTPAWQLLKEKYTTDEYPDLYSIYKRISGSAARHMGADKEHYERVFFNLLWRGWLACSTPVIANMGTTRGCPVSCSGNFVGDSVYEFYESQKEIAVLTKNGFGTSSYLGNIRGRGRPISSGGTASGVLPVLKDFIQLSRDVSQGNTRRGAWAGYIEIEHEDFWEIITHLQNNPDDFNLGWIISDEYIAKLNAGDGEALERYQRALRVKMLTGKGYFFFTDRVHEQQPQLYKDQNLRCTASQLCTEITLHSDEFHTYTCVLSSMNLSLYDEWKDTDAVQNSIIFLDCVAEEFIQMGKGIKGLEKAVRFTEKSRALGLGALGYHTYLQSKSIPFESFEAHQLNKDIFKHIRKEANLATKKLAKLLGEPEWCKGYGVRNTHLLAIAPNTSSALVCGSVSQGIEPVYKNAFVQGSAGGEINRVNSELIKVLQAYGQYTDATISSIINNGGSVSHLGYLSLLEQEVFKTAFEINQESIIRLASARQKYICQAQSINLFFPADESEEVISAVHKLAFNDKYIKSLYYIRSEAGVQGSTGECVACEG